MIELTDEQTEVLEHTLGAGNRYKKSKWGFRNRFNADEGHSDFKTLESLEKKGLMVRRKYFDGFMFHSTQDGAKAIGFKSAQLKRAFEDD